MPESWSGNIVKSPQQKNVNGREVTEFTIAHTPEFYDPETQKREKGETMFIGVSAWGDLGKRVAKNFRKGQRAWAEGELEVSEGRTTTFYNVTARDAGLSVKSQDLTAVVPERSQGVELGIAQ